MPQTREDSIETPYGWMILAASLAVITAAVASNYLVVIGITWAFFQHLFSGLRHYRFGHRRYLGRPLR